MTSAYDAKLAADDSALNLDLQEVAARAMAEWLAAGNEVPQEVQQRRPVLGMLEVTIDGKFHGVCRNDAVGRNAAAKYVAANMRQTAHVTPTARTTQGAKRLDK